MFRPLDDRGRPRVWFIVCFTGFTALLVLVAAFLTVAGMPDASLWWVLAGFFLFVLGMMLSSFAMTRLWEKAVTERRQFAPVGEKWIGPMLLAGVALIVLGGLGVVSEALVAGCVGSGSCQPGSSLASPTSLAVLAVGVSLLAGSFILASRRAGRSAGSGCFRGSAAERHLPRSDDVGGGMAHTRNRSISVFDGVLWTAILFLVFAVVVGLWALSQGAVSSTGAFGFIMFAASVVSLLAWASLLSHITFKEDKRATKIRMKVG